MLEKIDITSLVIQPPPNVMASVKWWALPGIAQSHQVKAQLNATTCPHLKQREGEK